jgi:hypothetical protein
MPSRYQESKPARYGSRPGRKGRDAGTALRQSGSPHPYPVDADADTELEVVGFGFVFGHVAIGRGRIYGGRG